MKYPVFTILSFLGLAVLAFVQYMFMKEVYDLKSREFDMLHQATLEDALYELSERYGQTGFDSLFYMMDFFADDWYMRCDTAREKDLKMVYEEVLGEVGQMIRGMENITPLLTLKLIQNKQEADLIVGYRIRELSLLDPFGLEEIDIPLAGDGNGAGTGAGIPGLYLNSFRAEGRWYRIAFDFYVDFTRKERVIYRSMMGYFMLALGSIMTVGMLFLVTIRSWKKQKKLSDLKSEFIGRITHDLKTPLTTISVAAKSLLANMEGSNNPRMKELIGVILRQNHFLSERIGQVLEVSFSGDTESARLKDLLVAGEFLEGWMTGSRRRCEDLGMVLEEDILLGNETLRGDPIQLTTMLNNLLDNALKYGGNNGVGVRSWWRKGWHVEISDRGPGMDAADREQAFEKFYRGEAGISTGSKGLGLGLYQVKLTVEAHGGEIRLRSQKGRGTTFHIYLPSTETKDETAAG